MLTIREYADLHGYKYDTVYSWVKKGLMQGAITHQSNVNAAGFVYMLPADAPPPPIRRSSGRKRTQHGVAVKLPPAPKEQPKQPTVPKRSQREINLFIRKHCKSMTYGQMSKALGIPTLKLREMYDYLHEMDGI